MPHLLGIDCATQPAKVGLAWAELSGHRVRVLHCRTASRTQSPAELAGAWLREAEGAVIALDAPLGWPLALGRVLPGHRAGQPMAASSNDLFRRATDLDIRGRFGKRPLEVGANFISRTAVAALELLDSLRQLTGEPIPLALSASSTGRFTAIEVYPAATRLAHGAPDRGGGLEGLEHLLDLSHVDRTALNSPDAIDAIVCALAAADFALGRAKPPSDPMLARLEGWIWTANPRLPA